MNPLGVNPPMALPSNPSSHAVPDELAADKDAGLRGNPSRVSHGNESLEIRYVNH